MRVRFWGTRGSLARPGPTTLRYGGNTACVEVESARGTLIVLDSGTGSFELGQSLLAPERAAPARGHLLLTHTHWDHIQGIPYFAPLFQSGQHWDIYAPHGLGTRLVDTLAGQMAYSYFPVRLDQLNATVECHDLPEGMFRLSDVRVMAQYANHPVLTLEYRLDAGGVSIAYATDHEPYYPPPADAPAGHADLFAHPEDRRHRAFVAGADLLIHDAQYTADEFRGKIGWGHSPAEYAVDLAVEGGVKHLVLFHHDPLRSDDGVDAIVEACRLRARDAGSTLQVSGAREGETLEFAEHRDDAGRTTAMLTEVLLPPSPRVAPASQTVLIVEDDTFSLHVLAAAMNREGFRLLTAPDGHTALRLARAEHPDLIVLDWMLPAFSGLEVCRALREGDDPRLRSVPILLVTARDEPEDMAQAFAAGATDFLAKPVPPARLRARARAWLLRRQRGMLEAPEPPA